MRATAFIILNEEIEDIMKIVKSHKEIGILMRQISETTKYKQRNKIENFFQWY